MTFVQAMCLHAIKYLVSCGRLDYWQLPISLASMHSELMDSKPVMGTTQVLMHAILISSTQTCQICADQTWNGYMPHIPQLPYLQDQNCEAACLNSAAVRQKCPLGVRLGSMKECLASSTAESFKPGLVKGQSCILTVE